MTNGPFLYDDDPAPLHTGTPRRRQGLLLALLAGIVLLAVGMAGALVLVKGTPDEQAREVVGVFLAALEGDDTETAHSLLCEAEQARLEPGEVAGEYLGQGGGRVVGTEKAEREDRAVQEVRVAWADGAESEFVVLSEDGPHLCGVTQAG
jgi:hypothetical protein